jgi:hypothetical protein
LLIVNSRRRHKNINKLAGNLRAVAQGDERDVRAKSRVVGALGMPISFLPPEIDIYSTL